MILFENWDLFALTLTIVGIGILGLIVFSRDTLNATNRAFCFFALCTILWGGANYASYQISTPAYILWALRLTIFFAVWHAYSFFLFVTIIPKEKFVLSSIQKVLLSLAAISSIINLSPYSFSKLETIGNSGLPSTATRGPGMALFIVVVLALVVGGIIFLVKHFRGAEGLIRSQLKLVLIGSTMTFVLLLFFSFLLPAGLNNVRYIPMGGFWILPMIIYSAYSIHKHNLFNLKLVGTQLFVGIICVVFFARVIISQTLSDRLIDGFIFLSTIFFGVLLVKSIKQETQQREEIAALAEQLSGANTDLERSNERLRIIDQRKSEFVSIVSHQLRTPITAIKGYTSLILENSFGPISDTVRPPIEKIYVSSKRLAEMVTDFLNISKIEQGTMTYVLKPVDVGAMITDLCDDFAHIAIMKKIELRVHVPEDEKFFATADDGKLRQIFSNLIDNSIKYTPTGSVDISVEGDKERGIILIKLKDTGIGLSQDDIHHLFGKFTRGIDGQRQNTEGSGLGLYVAKKMLEAQGGDVFVDSEGPGRGSTFAIQLNAQTAQ